MFYYINLYENTCIFIHVLQGPYVYHVLCTDWATLVKYE